MKKIICIVGMLLAACVSYSQNVKVDANGNYTAIKNVSAPSGGKPTGKTYTDTKGIVYPVMISKNGKLFIVRTSKSGNKYNQYLKP